MPEVTADELLMRKKFLCMHIPMPKKSKIKAKVMKIQIKGTRGVNGQKAHYIQSSC